MWIFTPSSAPASVETPKRDYRFRTSVPFATLSGDLAGQAAGIDYPNFKSEVARRQGPDRAQRYGRIWAVMHDLQQDANLPDAP